jgi:inosine/xanthosine triphosphate pyrophosphatase family protein
MSDKEKNAISHRARALRKLQKYLLEKKGHMRGM